MILLDSLSVKLRHNLRRKVVPELRMGFNESHYVREVLLSLALASRFIGIRPYLSTEDILQAGDRHGVPQDIPLLGSREKLLVPGIGL